MGAITIEEARRYLAMWLKAEEKVAVSGQSYKIGNRTLTRANLSEITKMRGYWENRVERLESKKGRGARGYKVEIFDN